MKYEVNFLDSTTGAKSAIDIISAPKDYTAEDYIKDCRDNADDEWNKMLETGTIELITIE